MYHALGYNARMHKDFYASGFFYHTETAQILLQQKQTSGDKTVWSLLGGMNKTKETVPLALKRVIQSLLKVKLDHRTFQPIYDYFSKQTGKTHFVSFVPVKKVKDFPGNKQVVFKWFSRKELLKLPLEPQSKQDLIIGMRVIDAQVRDSLPPEISKYPSAQEKAK